MVITYLLIGMAISIHASAREATVHVSRICATVGYFNPRLREGGDDITRFS